MKKITKRLLSVLAVLALVLTMAPAGILAVETKAESQFTPGQANLPAGIADKQVAAAAKQAAAKAALAALESEGAAARLAELNTELTTCPFCGKAATWVAPSTTAVNLFGTGNHYYINGAFWFDKVTANSVSAFLAEKDGDSACILLDSDKVDLGGTRILMSKAATLNIGGIGNLYSGMGYVRSTSYDTGIISLGGTGVHELNLYGGAYYTIREVKTSKTVSEKTTNYYHGVIYNCGASNTVNIWTDDVTLGASTLNSTYGALNLYQTKGVTNIYAGTLRNGYSMIAYQGFNVFISGSSTVNMYGGKVQGGSGVSNARGANVYIHESGKFNMYGGEISGGTVTGSYAMGGNISSMASSSAVINLQGGTVKDGSATKGGNVNLKLGTLKVGGTALVEGGKNATEGGNIYVNKGDGTGAFTIEDNATITGGTVSSNGGNIWLSSTSTAELKGGVVKNGTASANGGNIFANGTVNLGKAEVKDGKAPYGGNIAIVNGTLKMTDDATVTGGTNKTGYALYGGNIFLRGAKAGTILKGSISNGIAVNGGNVHACAASKVEVAANLTGGTAKFGANLHANTYMRDGSINLTAAVTVSITGGTISGGVHENVNNNGTYDPEEDGYEVYIDCGADGLGTTLTLKNNVDIESLYFVKADGKNILTIDPSWSGEAGFQSNVAYYCGGKIADGYASAAFPGTLTNMNGNHGQLVWDGETGIKMVDYEVISTDGSRLGYADAAEAVAAANGDLNKRLVAAGDVELNGETIVIDGIGDVNVTGTGTIYGIDQTNDGYTGHSGVFTVGEGVTIAPEVTYNSKHYIAITGGDNGNKYTFHRVEIELTNVTVNVDKEGIYYKAQYKFDEVVKGRVDSYGVLLNLNEAPTEDSLATSSSELGGYADATLVAASHGVYGIFKEGKDSNLADGKTKVFGNPYLKINTNGEESSMFTAAESTGKSLADVMELANEKWDQLTADGQAALKAFVDKWNALGAWETDLIAKLTNFYPAEA